MSIEADGMEWSRIGFDPPTQSITMEQFRNILYCDWGNEDRTATTIAIQQQEAQKNYNKYMKVMHENFYKPWMTDNIYTGPKNIDPKEKYFKELYKEQQKQLTMRNNGMTNYTTILFAFNKKLRAVKVTYEPEQCGYTYKTLDPDIKVGDYVVIPTTTRHKMTIGQVSEVDILVDIDSSLELKWIIGKVDKQAHDVVIKGEEEIVNEIKQSEANARIKQIQENMAAFKTDKLKTMALVDLSEPQADNTPSTGASTL